MPNKLATEIIMTGKTSIENLGSDSFKMMDNELLDGTFINLWVNIGNTKFRVYKPKNSKYVQIDIKNANELIKEIKETQREFSKYRY
jgi:hypothetical protein